MKWDYSRVATSDNKDNFHTRGGNWRDLGFLEEKIASKQTFDWACKIIAATFTGHMPNRKIVLCEQFVVVENLLWSVVLTTRFVVEW